MKHQKLLVLLLAVAFIVLPFAAIGGLLMLAGSAAGMACPSGSNLPNGKQGDANLNSSLAEAIKANAKGNGRLAASMLFGSYIESRWNPATISGDGAFGAFQIQSPGVVHPDITVEQALNPAYATNYMLPAYQSALRVVDPSLWLSNPEQAMMKVAFAAERPKYSYDEPVGRGQGPAAVREGYLATVQALSEMGLQLGVSTDIQAEASVNISNTPADACGQYTSVSLAYGPSVQAVLQAAQSQLGVPYVFGGGNLDGPSGSSLASGVGFDCASYVRYSFHKAGIDLPAGSRAQYLATLDKQVQSGQEQPGDLVFFGGYTGKANGPGHVGIVIDPAKKLMYSEPRTGDVARISSYDWGNDVMGFTRPYPPAEN